MVKIKFLKNDLEEIDKEIKVINKRITYPKLFDSLIRSDKGLWNTYYLNLLIFERDKMLYFQQKYNDIIESIRKNNEELNNKLQKKDFKVEDFESLKEWVEDNPLNDLFVITVGVKDIKRLINDAKKGENDGN